MFCNRVPSTKEFQAEYTSVAGAGRGRRRADGAVGRR